MLLLSSQKLPDYRQLRPSLCLLIFLNLLKKFLILKNILLPNIFYSQHLFSTFPKYLDTSDCKFLYLNLKLLCLLIQFYKGMFPMT